VHLPSKHKALNSNPSAEEREEGERGKKGGWIIELSSLVRTGCGGRPLSRRFVAQAGPGINVRPYPQN
jgi:hypothetical protein